MARVLVISNSVPYAPGPGAATREFNLARALLREHGITYVLAKYNDTQSARAQLLAQYCQVRMYEPYRARRTLLYRLNWSLQKRIPVNAVGRYIWGEPLMVQDLEAVLWGLERELHKVDWRSFDIVQIAHSHMAAIIKRVPIPLPIVVDWHNVYTEYYRRMASQTKDWRSRLINGHEHDRMRQHERWVLKRADRAVSVSSVDEAHLKSLVPSARISIVPNGVDCEYFENPHLEKQVGEHLVFTGTMDYPPNCEAVQYFTEQILPRIWQSRPGVRFYVVGKSPCEEIRALEKQFPDRVFVTGEVDDVRPFLQDAVISVVPLLNGSGTRLKILEAMAMQKPVVSTSVGAEGLEVIHGRDLLIADSPAEFADCVLALLQDQNRRQEIAERGNRLVRKHYDWRVISERLSEVWEEVLSENKS